MLALIPAPADKSRGDAAEAAGRTGKISALGVGLDIEQIAKTQGSTAAACCKQIADAVKQMRARLPK